ncbi:hypothetical protein GF378_03160 [Candidatus Pacearchaeota archaeon]|nr:hypothetical protein [Candidatus Pacearchaeota archaeon]
MKIKDKIIIINNFKSEIRTFEEIRNNEEIVKKINPAGIIRKNLIKIIEEEILPLVEMSKELTNKLLKNY